MSSINETAVRPLVTFALFAYNQEKYIREALEGAFAQTYEPLEIILSDDCSTDRTFEIMKQEIEKYSGVHKIILNKNKQNLGLAGHINKMMELSSGELIVVAAGDDISFPNKASSLVNPMLEDENVMGVHSDCLVIDINGDTLYQGGNETPEDLLDPYLIVERSLGIVSQSHAFRKRVHDFFGPYDLDVTNEGKVMAFRESIMGKIVYMKVPLTYYRTGSGISTYDGTDVDKLTIEEPRKVAKWNYSAIKQIAKDAKLVESLDPQLKKLIHKRLTYLSTIYKINTSGLALSDLLTLATAPANLLAGIKALARVNAPKFLRRLYCRYILSAKRT